MKKPQKAGNINAAFLATLYKGKKVVGYCMDTPNAVAFGMAQTGATKAVSRFSKFKKGQQVDGFERTDKDGFVLLNVSRIQNAGWVTAEQAQFKTVSQAHDVFTKHETRIRRQTKRMPKAMQEVML